MNYQPASVRKIRDISFLPVCAPFKIECHKLTKKGFFMKKKILLFLTLILILTASPIPVSALPPASYGRNKSKADLICFFCR